MSGANAVEPSMLSVPAGSVGAEDLPPPGMERSLAVTWHAVRVLLPPALAEPQAATVNASKSATAPITFRLNVMRVMIPPQKSQLGVRHCARPAQAANVTPVA